MCVGAASGFKTNRKPLELFYSTLLPTTVVSVDTYQYTIYRINQNSQHLTSNQYQSRVHKGKNYDKNHRNNSSNV